MAYNGIRLEWEKLLFKQSGGTPSRSIFNQIIEIRLVKEKTLEGVIDGLELSGEFRI